MTGSSDSFMESMMITMGRVTSVSYSILFRGGPFGHFIPSGVLRQGDPISPYLFLIVAEGFSAPLQKAKLDCKIHGVAIALEAPPMNHLFSAGDSLLF